MNLAVEKLFVLAAGLGGGLIIFGASWRIRRPSPTDTWNRRFFDKGFRDIRYGAGLLLVSLLGLAVVHLL
jgi:hypothetical protein